jgi:chemotaxis protein CheZ
MSSQAEQNADTPDLEALFDSIVEAAVPAPAKCAANDASEAGDVITRIGKMTRTLHDSLRALGLDKTLETAVAAMPDARDRLAYVARMTEQAADRVLNATDAARPIQEKLAAQAGSLTTRWEQLYACQLSTEQFKELAGQTREFLHNVPEQTRLTNAQLTEVMLAQDFQDLTGQVIKKIADVVHDLENKLLNLLLENAPPAKRQGADSLLNGPVVNGAGRTDIAADQQQVDDLLESLGF